MRQQLESLGSYFEVESVSGQIDKFVPVVVGQVNNQSSGIRVQSATAAGTISKSGAVLLQLCEDCFIVGDYSVFNSSMLTEGLVLDAVAIHRSLIGLGETDVLCNSLEVDLLAIDLGLNVAAELVGLGQIRVLGVESSGSAKVAADLFVQLDYFSM